MTRRLVVPPSTSIHVYLPGKPTLDRLDFEALLKQREWLVTCLDPHDRRPLRGGLVWDDLIVGTRPQNPTDAQECTLVTESPFEARRVLGDIDGFEVTFGARGVEILKKAKAIQAFNGPANAVEEGHRFLLDMAEAVATFEKGWVYNCQSGQFK
jgi:hypothetical protein